MKLKCYHLVGVPATGKSTWVKSQTIFKEGEFTVVSSDKFIDDHAEKEGKTYNGVFNDYAPIAMRLMENHALIAQANNLNIFWDQTNVSVKSRKKKFDLLPNYEHIAVVFPIPDKDEHDRRLASRPGKSIPDNVMRSMMDNFQMPTTDEGYTQIVVL